MLCSIYTIFMSRNEEIPVYNRIAEQREQMGMSRQQLAESVGVCITKPLATWKGASTALAWCLP